MKGRRDKALLVRRSNASVSSAFLSLSLSGNIILFASWFVGLSKEKDKDGVRYHSAAAACGVCSRRRHFGAERSSESREVAGVLDGKSGEIRERECQNGK